MQILQHSLGLDMYGLGVQYRNHFVAGGDDIEKCKKLVDMEYMVERKASKLSGGSPVFNVTKKGINVVGEESPSPPKRTKSQRRYAAYLSSETDESFFDWLKNSYWNKYRQRLGVA